MSRIDDLIAEHCPDGVEFATLGEVGSLYGGLTGKSKRDFTGGNSSFVSYMNVFSTGVTDLEANDRVHVAPGERQNKVRRGDVLFTASSENMGEVGMSSVVLADPDGDLYLNSFLFRFSTGGSPHSCCRSFPSTSLGLPPFVARSYGLPMG